MQPKATKDTRVEIAATIMRRLNVLPAYITAFEKNGIVTQYEQILGGGYYIDSPEGKQEIAEIQEIYQDALVFAVTEGTYILGGTDQVTMKSFLLVTEKDAEQYLYNCKHPTTDPLDGIVEELDGYGLNVFAFVKGIDDELGYVCVKGLNGGIKRTA